MLWECCLETSCADGAIQPTLWESSPNPICCYEAHAAIFRSDSIDYGATRLLPARIPLPNNNSGIDLASMQDGTLILALKSGQRHPGKALSAFTDCSRDIGESWLPLLTRK